jgi:hypothetical protein
LQFSRSGLNFQQFSKSSKTQMVKGRKIVKNNTNTIHSLDELKTNPKKVLAKLQRSGKPILLTENGQPEFMLIDIRKLYKKIGTPRLQRLIEEAEADIAAGRVEDFDQFMKRFRDAHNL